MLHDFLKCGTVLTTPDRNLLVGWGERTWRPNPIDTNKINFFFPDYFLENSDPWFSHQHWAELSIDEFLSEIKIPTYIDTKTWNWKNSHRTVFEQSFSGLKSQFASGELLKAVPYVFEETNHAMSTDHLGLSLRTLLTYVKKHPVHCYGFWENGQGVLGATPEMLFRLNRSDKLYLETVACAGTKKLDQFDSSLLSNPKELYEHDLVIKGIKSSLTKLGGEVETHQTNLLKLSKLAHLSTPISATLDKATTFDDIVKALHPTPALGAIPIKSGMTWLKDYNKMIPRNRFGAPAGYLRNNGQEGFCLVAIRNAQWKPGWMGLGAGCGIVPDSQLDHEWKELQLKIESIKEMLAL